MSKMKSLSDEMRDKGPPEHARDFAPSIPIKMNSNPSLEEQREKNNRYYREWYHRQGRESVNRRNEEYRLKNWEKRKADIYKYQAKHKDKAAARVAVNNAVYAGKFEKLPCQECNETKVNFHHTHGYDKEHWFTGVWLCTKHHAELHVKLRRAKELGLGADK